MSKRLQNAAEFILTTRGPRCTTTSDLTGHDQSAESAPGAHGEQVNLEDLSVRPGGPVDTHGEGATGTRS